MAWYYGTYRCNHDGRVNIIGPVKDRQWKADREFSKMCPECWKKHLEEKRQKANEEAAKLAQEMELPELFGSEKQVAWANTIRQNLIEAFGKVAENEKALEELDKCYNIKVAKEEVLEIRDYIIENKTDARYYIDNRDTRIAYIIEKEMKEALKSEEEIIREKIEKKTELEIKAEATVKPENYVTKTIAEITVKEDKITVICEKNDKFREIVKDLGFKWEGIWERKINEYTGKAEDRAAELGNKLLNAGFPIMILDETIRNNAINAIYEKECTRWIKFRKKENLLAINWQGRDDKLYKTARKIPGSKWSSPSVVVKPERYKEVEEFAELYGFKFSKAALMAIEEYKKATEKIEVVRPEKVKEGILKDGLEEILSSNSDILESLKDD